MHLHLASDAPPAIRAAALSLLALHLAAGTVGLGAGATALATRKGGRLHRRAGRIFVLSLLAMAGIGAVILPVMPKWSSAPPGLFTAYLAATAWQTVRRPAGQTGRTEALGAGAGFAIAAFGIGLGLYAATSPSGRASGAAPIYFYLIALPPALAAALDLKIMGQGGIRGAQRLARHIWRMSAAMIILVVSFLAAQPESFPPWLRSGPVVFGPALAVLGLMTFWLIQSRGSGAGKPVSQLFSSHAS